MNWFFKTWYTFAWWSTTPWWSVEYLKFNKLLTNLV
jgi:hypothetical protein